MTISLSVFVCVCVRLWGVILFSLEHSNNLERDVRVSQGCLLDFSGVSKGCLMGVPSVLQGCSKGV